MRALFFLLDVALGIVCFGVGVLATAFEFVARRRRLGRLYETRREAFDAMDEALRKKRR